MARLNLQFPEDQYCFSTQLTVRITDINAANHLANDSMISMISEARARFLFAYGVPETRQDGSRVYPFGTTMAAVTGYNGENIGSAGIEGHANQALLGLTADMSRLGPLSQLLQSERGNDVKRTIEPAAQKAAAAALGKRRGALQCAGTVIP